MIAITKEFKQILQEQFNKSGVTQIQTTDLADALNISIKELELMLKDESLKDEFKLISADDGTKYIARFILLNSDGKTLANAFNIQWDNIGGCPCFTCYELDRCDIGNPISSVDCPLFTRWLFAEKKEEK